MTRYEELIQMTKDLNLIESVRLYPTQNSIQFKRSVTVTTKQIRAYLSVSDFMFFINDGIPTVYIQ